jgi:hypothetical protein
MDLKVKEAHDQIKLVESSLLTEFFRLKNYHEQTLSDCKQFDNEMQDKLIQWHKKLNSIEYRRNSSKLQSIQNEIEVDFLKISQKREALNGFVPINRKFSFKEKEFIMNKDPLGVFNEERDPTWSQRLVIGGLRNVCQSLWQILFGLFYFLTGLCFFAAGLIVYVLGHLNFFIYFCQSLNKVLKASRKLSFKFYQGNKCGKIKKES